MINCILGKSKTGKTTHIYNMIEQDLKEGLDVLLFVPSQSRAKAEEEYIRILNKSGVIGVNITTISEYINEQLKLQNMHIEDNFLSSLDRKIILTQVIRENEGIFKVFNKVKNYAGFLDILDIYMDLFRKSGIAPKEASALEVKDKRTNTKFKEILSIYEKYIDKMTQNYIDSVDEMELFIKNINKSDIFTNHKNLKVYFDSYNNFTNNEYKFIDILMKNKIDITLTLNTDITKIEETYISSSIFETSNKTYKRICALADKNNISLENIIKYENVFDSKKDIKYIANNIFSNMQNKEKIDLENIDVTVYTNIQKEIEAVAKKIASKIKDGYRYSDFAVYTTKIEEYEKIISRVFYENNLKYYLPKSKSICESILVKYIQGILNLASKGLNLELVFDILKQGITDIDLRKIYILENYMKEFNVNKYIVDSKFTLNNQKAIYDIEELNNLKDKVISMYSFVNYIKSGTCGKIIEEIYNHLSKENIYKNYLKLTEPIIEDSINMDMNNFESQVWSKLLEIFESIEKVYKDEEITIEEFTNIFNLVVKDIKIKTLPPTKDQVEIVDINVSKVKSKKIAFFIGVTEGKFPEKVDEDIIFSDNELDILRDKNIDLKETSISKINMGYFNIYEALNNVKEALYISIPAASFDGKATRKSILITLMNQISNFSLNGEVTKNYNLENMYEYTSKDDLFMWLLKSIRNMDDSEDISKIYSVYEFFKLDKEYSKILSFKKDDSKLSKDITDIIYNDEFKTSVSKLELYKKCPFSYFMQYVLKILPNKESKVNVLELGSFMHGVLESFSKRLLEKNIKWQEILDENLEDIKPQYEKILEEIIFSQIDANLSKQKQSVKYMVLKRKLTNTMKKIIKTVALSYNQSEFEPYDYEIEFKDNSVFLPMQIDLDNGKTMKIIGKIDRVDMLEFKENMYIRVVDYKSSSKELKIDKIKEGISLQLISYMIAFMENKKDKKIIPAGMVYFNLSDKLINLQEYMENNDKVKQELIKRLKMNGIFLKDIEILNKMDRNFEKNSKESLIDVSKASITRDSSKVLDEKEFEELCKNTKIILSDIGKEISNGNVKIAPNKKENYCKFCNYSTTCRKNIEV